MEKEYFNETAEVKFKEKFINPFTDFGFKKIFGEECNKELLIDFLNELLHKEEGKIVSITYLKTEKLGISIESRKAVFDLYCENENGEKFIVELQNSKQEYFKDRTVYYSTFAITDQAVQGDKWNYKLKNVYVVAILNFNLEENKNNPDKFRYDVMLTDIETNDIFYEKLKYVYLEMPKFNKEVDELKTHFDKWMYVIKNLNRLDDIPDKLREKIFKKMFAAAEIAKLTPEEYRAYIDSLKSYRDYKNTIDYAKAEGKIEGKIEEKVEIAKELKSLGMPFEQISIATKLTIEEIEKI